jgi:hypothetical protein
LEQHKGDFHNFKIQVSLENRKAFVLMDWVQPGGTVAWVSFKLTVVSLTGIGKRRCAAFPSDRQAVDRPTLTCGIGTTSSLSLSSDYKEENVGRSFLLFTIFPIA